MVENSRWWGQEAFIKDRHRNTEWHYVGYCWAVLNLDHIYIGCV